MLGEELILIAAIAGAIFIFAWCYARTVREYLALLRLVQPAVNGKIKSTFLYSSILLRGQYKGREVVCAIEQLKEGGDALVVKVKLHAIPLQQTLFEQKNDKDKVVLSGGWLAPRFCISKHKFNKESFLQQLDRILLICDTLERHPQKSVLDKKVVPDITHKTLDF